MSTGKWLGCVLLVTLFGVMGCGSGELSEQQAIEQEKADAASNAGDNAADTGSFNNKRKREDQED